MLPEIEGMSDIDEQNTRQLLRAVLRWVALRYPGQVARIESAEPDEAAAHLWHVTALLTNEKRYQYKLLATNGGRVVCLRAKSL